MNLELSEVAVQSLVPAPLQNVASADDFMQQLPEYDADLAQQVEEAAAAAEVLRFVGKPPASACGAAWRQSLSVRHAFWHLQTWHSSSWRCSMPHHADC